MKLQKSKSGQFFLSLPKALVEAKEWDKGQELKLRLGPNGQIEIWEKLPGGRGG